MLSLRVLRLATPTVSASLGSITRRVRVHRTLKKSFGDCFPLKKSSLTQFLHSNQPRSFHNTTASRASQQRESGPDANGIVPFILSDPGEGIAECEVLRWAVKEGDRVSQFDLLCEIQSDKAVAEITSRYDGVISKIHYGKGQMAKVGKPLVDIFVGKPGTQDVSKAQVSTEQPKPLGRAEENLSPSVVPLGSPDMGLGGKKQPVIQEGGHLKNMPPLDEEERHSENAKAIASPAVRHMARKHSISLSQVKPSGKDGRILKEDVLEFINNPRGLSPESEVLSRESSAQSPALQVQSTPELLEDRIVPLTGYSRVMAKTMTQSLTIPHFGYCDEISAEGLMRLRSQLKSAAESQGIKLTYMPIILKATSLALIRYPQLNASFNDSSFMSIQKSSHNIGVAMNTPNGLVVPNIKDVQKKSILEIAKEMNRLQAAAGRAALSREDLTNGSFSISNIGTIGGTYASPVIVPPEVAIGAIGKIQKLPRFASDGTVVPAHIFNISWSADHRVIDGATMANFSNLWKEYIENPSAMLFELK